MGGDRAMSKAFNIAAAILALALAIGLYRAKTETEAVRARVAALERQLAAERAEMKTLAAERAYLENPARIEALAREKLGLQPAAPGQLRSQAEIGAVLPPAKGAAP